MRNLFFLVVLLFSTSAFANVCLDIKAPESDLYEFHPDVEVESFDGVIITGNLLVPTEPKEVYPTVIFVNSWVMDEHEYLKHAVELAKNGFQVLSYSTRGFGCSGGQIDVIGPKDVKDLHHIVDWLEAHTKVDRKNIGITGISYGGGMTLMALAKEERIKTGFAMSGWGSLTDALYGNRTPRMFWGSFLVGTGWLMGQLDPKIFEMFKNLIREENIEETLAWAEERSPINFIEEINKRQKPVYISNNFGDNLFQPNNVLNFYQKLTGPKILDLNQGSHATGELPGIFTASNYTFKKMHSWFNHWLKGDVKDKGLALNQINVQTKLEHKREKMPEVLGKDYKVKKLYLHPKDFISGKLSSEKFKDSSKTESYFSGRDTIATTGIPFLSAIIDGNFKLPVYAYIPFRSVIYGLNFVSSSFGEKLKIRGVPKLNLTIRSNTKDYQIISYLYDVGPFGFGKLITHGVYSGNSETEKISFDMTAMAYDLPKGHKLALFFDTQDSLYGSKTKNRYRVEIDFDQSSVQAIEIPVVE